MLVIFVVLLVCFITNGRLLPKRNFTCGKHMIIRDGAPLSTYFPNKKLAMINSYLVKDQSSWRWFKVGILLYLARILCNQIILIMVSSILDYSLLLRKFVFLWFSNKSWKKGLNDGFNLLNHVCFMQLNNIIINVYIIIYYTYNIYRCSYL